VDMAVSERVAIRWQEMADELRDWIAACLADPRLRTTPGSDAVLQQAKERALRDAAAAPADDLALNDWLRQQTFAIVLGVVWPSYESKFVNLVRRRVWNQDDADDIVQGTAHKAIHRCLDFWRYSLTLYGWLCALVHQQTVDWIRQRARTGRLMEKQGHDIDASQPGNLTTPTLAARRKETRERLLDLIQGLDPIDRQILILHHLEAFPLVEIADLLNLEEANVRQRHLRARRWCGEEWKRRYPKLPGGLAAVGELL